MCVQRQCFATRLVKEAEAGREPVTRLKRRVSSLPRELQIPDGGKGGDSGEEVEAVVRWNDKRNIHETSRIACVGLEECKMQAACSRAVPRTKPRIGASPRY